MFTQIQFVILIMFCVNATFAVNFAFRFGLEKKPQSEMNGIIMSIFITSAIWSIGMGMMSVQRVELKMYIWRIVGILGTFMFLMAVQKMLCIIAELKRRYQLILNGIASSGFLVYLLYITPGQTIFVRNNIGVTFYFKQGLINIIYATYFSLVCLNILIVTIYMLRNHKLMRVRVMARNLIVVEFCIFVGAIFDMVLPTFGIPAIPGSAITHFWGVFVFWFAIHGMYRAKITIANMSEYIYYSLDIPVLVLDNDKFIKIINDASATFFNLKASIITEKDYEISDLFDVDKSVFDFEDKSNNVNAVCITNNAICELAISKIQDDYGDIVGFILIVNDMTEHNLVVKRLQQAKLEADAANMSKSLFLANMSHEIRTPMNAILGFAELALMDDIDDAAKEYISDMKTSGETLLAIINDVLNISKIEIGKQELNCNNYSPSRIFKDVELIIGVPAREKQLGFEMIIDDKFPAELYGDKDKLREILINLLNNSVKYTKAGRVKFEANVLSNNNSVAEIEFKVTDTGIGIKQEDIGKIFEKFQRVDIKSNSATEGTGLGLPITKGLVELMGGTIKVDSVYGAGSVFTVVIPQNVVDSNPIQLETVKEESAKREMLFRDVKFLAVDDNRVNLKVISKTMERYGIAYDLADSGKSAIDKCKLNQYDVVLMDQMMPVMDGVEAMKLIRILPNYGKESNAKIVALTANVIEGVKEELLSIGFDGFLGKPIDFKAFESVLGQLLPPEKIYYKDAAVEEEVTTAPVQRENEDGSRVTVINYEKGLENFADDEDGLREIMGYLVETSQADLEELLDYYNQNDIENFVIKVHGMKSQCNYIGGENMGALCKEMEFAGKRDDLDYIKSNIDDFREKYITFSDAVDKLLKKET